MTQVRIVGGVETKSGEIPWRVFVVGSFFCTGTIISPNWVLTAAHCLMDVKDVKNVVVYAGAHSDPVKNGEKYPAVAYFKHPKFNRGVLLNGIALIHVKPQFAYKSYVIKWKLSLHY